MLTSEHPEPHLVLPKTSTPTQPLPVSRRMPSSVAIERINRILVRIAQQMQETQQHETLPEQNTKL